MSQQQDPIALTIDFVKNTLASAEAGHDWLHIERVYNNARAINAAEKANDLIVSLAALLHDIYDSKFNNGDEEMGPREAGKFLRSINVDEAVVTEVQLVIKNMSYKASLGVVEYHSAEMDVVSDADKLDAIGAMGIARAFTYGGFKNRKLYDPEVPPNPNMTKEEYKNTTGPTINHFFEKLVKLKDLMKTQKGKEMAQQRHEYMMAFVDQFYAEIEGRR